MYEEALRDEAHIKPKKFGFLFEVTPKRLWGQQNLDYLRPLVDKEMKDKPESHRIGMYARVLKKEWHNTPADVKKKYLLEAKCFNDGNGSIEMKAA